MSIFELFGFFFILTEHLCDAPERQLRLPDQRSRKKARRRREMERERERERERVSGDDNIAVNLWDCG